MRTAVEVRAPTHPRLRTALTEAASGMMTMNECI
jgi:hypothetical protein